MFTLRFLAPAAFGRGLVLPRLGRTAAVRHFVCKDSKSKLICDCVSSLARAVRPEGAYRIRFLIYEISCIPDNSVKYFVSLASPKILRLGVIKLTFASAVDFPYLSAVP